MRPSIAKFVAHVLLLSALWLTLAPLAPLAAAPNWRFPAGDIDNTNRSEVKKLAPYLGTVWAMPVAGVEPLVVSGSVAVMMDHAKNSLMGIDIGSGKVQWAWEMSSPNTSLWGIAKDKVYLRVRAFDESGQMVKALGFDLASGATTPGVGISVSTRYDVYTKALVEFLWNGYFSLWMPYSDQVLETEGAPSPIPGDIFLKFKTMEQLWGDAAYRYPHPVEGWIEHKYTDIGDLSRDLRYQTIQGTATKASFGSDCLYRCQGKQRCPDGGRTWCGEYCTSVQIGNPCEFTRSDTIDLSTTVTYSFDPDIQGGPRSTPAGFLFQYEDHTFVTGADGMIHRGSPVDRSLGIQADRFVAIGKDHDGRSVIVLKSPLEVFDLDLPRPPGTPTPVPTPGEPDPDAEAGLPLSRWRHADLAGGPGAILADGSFLYTDGESLRQVDLIDGSELQRISGASYRPYDGATVGGFTGQPVPLENGVLVYRQVPSPMSYDLSYQLEFLGSPLGYPHHGVQLLGRYRINSLTGNYLVTREDLTLPGRGLSVLCKRTYNSNGSSQDGSFGLGWSFNYDMSVSYAGPGKIAVNQPDGGTATFVVGDPSITLDKSSTTPIPLYGVAGVSNRLERLPTGQDSFRYTTKDGTQYNFGSIAESRPPPPEGATPPAANYGATHTGRLLSINDPNGNTLTFTYSRNLGANDKRVRLVAIDDASGRQITLSHDGDGHITAIHGPGGYSRSFSYNRGQLIGVDSSAGQVATYSYHHESGKLSGLDDVDGAKGQKHVRLKYDEDTGRVTEAHPASDPLATTKYTYSDQPDLPLSTFPSEWADKAATRIETALSAGRSKVALELYDIRGRVSERREYWGIGASDFNSTKYGWDQRNNQSWIINAKQARTDFEYSRDGRDNLTAKVDPEGGRTVYTYTDADKVKTITTPLGIETTNVYDARLNLTEVHQGTKIPASIPGVAGLDNGGVLDTYYKYDEKGQCRWVIDPKGNKTEFDYDSNGNRTETRMPESRTTNATYDERSRLRTSTNARRKTTVYRYGLNDLLEHQQLPGGKTLDYSYDANRNLYSVTDEKGRASITHYDDRDHLTYTESPRRGRTDYVYDKLGNKESETDARTHTRTFEYDLLGRLKKATDPVVAEEFGSSGSVSFRYDALGNMERAEASNGLVSEWEYDSLNRQTAARHHNGATFDTYGYDADSRVTTHDNGLTSQVYVYDAHARPVRIDYSGPGPKQRVDYKYDKNGNAYSALWYENGALRQQLAYAFSANNQVTLADMAGLPGLQQHYTYDPNGNVDTLSLGLGGSAGLPWLAGTGVQDYRVEYKRDDQDRVYDVLDGTHSVAAFHYDSSDLNDVAYYNGATSTFKYEPGRGRLQSVTQAGPGGIYQKEEYGYDAVSNVISWTNDLGEATFTYDALNRLGKATYPNSGVIAAGPAAPGTVEPATYPTELAWKYDATGSRVSQTRKLNGQTLVRSYTNNDGILAKYDGDGPEVTFAYQAGHATQAEGITLDYDSFGHVVKAGTEEFAYGPFGSRYKRITKGVETWVVGAGALVIAEIEKTEAGAYKLRRTYHHDAGGRVLRKREISFEEAQPETKDAYYLYDKRSSVSVLTDGAGGLLQKYHYLPFGEGVEGGDAKNRYRFAGKERLEEAELLDFGARNLAAQAGRWIAPDPVQLAILSPQALNRYVYVRNNPMTESDPNGAWDLQEAAETGSSDWDSNGGHNYVQQTEENCSPADVAATAEEAKDEVNPQPTPTPEQPPTIGPAPETDGQFKDKDGNDVFQYNTSGKQGSTGNDWRRWAGDSIGGAARQVVENFVLTVAGCPECATANSIRGTVSTVHGAGVLLKRDADAFLAPPDPNIRVTVQRGAGNY